MHVSATPRDAARVLAQTLARRRSTRPRAHRPPPRACAPRARCRRRTGTLRGTAVLGIAGMLIGAGACARPPDPALAALARSRAWLEAHVPDPARDRLGFLSLDVWTWFAFAAWHPDAAVRALAATETDTRLRALAPPPRWTAVELSYWAVVVRLTAARGIDVTAPVAALRQVDLDAVLRTTAPTTAWWTRALLAQLGIDAAPSLAGTFLGTHGAGDAGPYRVDALDAYRIFHEVAPAAALGLRPPAGLSARQTAFAAETVGALIAAAQAIEDADAVAEATFTAALLGRRGDPAYHAGIAWLLEHQRPDGTYRSGRDATRRMTSDDFRHVVLVGSLALLSALDRFPAADAP